jgi:hypothetical protein
MIRRAEPLAGVPAPARAGKESPALNNIENVCRPTAASAMKRKAAAPAAPTQFLKKGEDRAHKRLRPVDTPPSGGLSTADDSQKIKDNNLKRLLTAKIHEALLTGQVRLPKPVADCKCGHA